MAISQWVEVMAGSGEPSQLQGPEDWMTVFRFSLAAHEAYRVTQPFPILEGL